MVWKIEYLPQVKDDLKIMGNAEARRILKIIENRMAHGEPEKSGKPLSGTLSGLRRIRTGNTRIVYEVNKGKIRILIVAVGMRRDSEVYKLAEKRVKG
ncbi:type II toxin-antitoxin system RelE/ParE family toxin [Endozoicomonas sp.]|uniref:type II toxin-antitoxin system RelE family toxin n=1 Tax=Endozoicomonas sp. TaxID=1892382 RepID=UPI0028870204|nr:type II toxin-antitoxin system RelE/ParE family toxin [Endozoicomonas sp.]